MSTYLLDASSSVNASISINNEMVANLRETSLTMPFVDVIYRVVLSLTCC